MDVQSLIIAAGVTVYSLGLLLVSMFGYFKYKNRKVLFISVVFLIFLLKGIIYSTGLLLTDISLFQFNPFFGLFDFIILLFLFIATLKR